MGMEKRKELEKKLFTVMLAGTLAVTSVTTVFAASGSGRWTIGAFKIDGSNSITATYGNGTTGGAAKPYSNYVVVSVYDKKNKRKGIGSSTAKDANASKTVLGVNLKRVYSCHGVYDNNYRLVDGVIKGINTSR